jgi:hypothetical protein
VIIKKKSYFNLRKGYYMTNVFTTKNNTDTLMRLETLKVLLEDYRAAYPEDEYIHEAWLTVISKIDDVEGL